MYRKMFSGIICLMLLAGTFFVPKVRADVSDKKTIVTVNEPIQVPGKVLPAGTYVFKPLDSNDRTLVAIYDADEMHVITTIPRDSGLSDGNPGQCDPAARRAALRPTRSPEGVVLPR